MGNKMVDANQFIDDPRCRQRTLESYGANGFVLFEGIFSSLEISAMRDVWAAVSDARRKDGKKPYASLLLTHISNPDVAKIVRNRRLVDCVEGLLGGNVELVQTQLMYGMPGSKGFTPHQDNYYNRAVPEDGIIAAWIALEDVDKENGCVAVYPASHKAGLAQYRKDWPYLLTRSPDILKSLMRQKSPQLRDQPNDSGVIERFVVAKVPEGAQPIDAELKAGSVLFIHGNVIHLSNPNTSLNRSRRSLVANYLRAGTTFRAGRLASRTLFNVHGR